MEGFLALLHLILAGIGWYFYAIIGMISLAIGALAGMSSRLNANAISRSIIAP